MSVEANNTFYSKLNNDKSPKISFSSSSSSSNLTTENSEEDGENYNLSDNKEETTSFNFYPVTSSDNKAGENDSKPQGFIKLKFQTLFFGLFSFSTIMALLKFFLFMYIYLPKYTKIVNHSSQKLKKC